ncbi:hypothetical protein EJB05_41302, partial [Eragrostis curvula]
MAKHPGSLVVHVQLLMCCTLMLLFARPVAPASRSFVPPAPAPTALSPTQEPTSPASPALSPATPTAVPAPALSPASPPAPKTWNFTWNVEYILWAPDCKQRGMIGINGAFPGPTITAKAGDRIVVVVNNHLHTEGVVIHWHGIRQIGTPWADGTASISQCAINPGESFTYNFTADKAGTFFYHGHFGMQRAAGLYGSLIVNKTEGEKEPFDYDDELNMLLSDWYHEAVYAQAAGLERKEKHFQWIGEPQVTQNFGTAAQSFVFWDGTATKVGVPRLQTLLINGKGQFDCTLGVVGKFQRGIHRDATTCDRRDGAKVEQMCDKDCAKETIQVKERCIRRRRWCGWLLVEQWKKACWEVCATEAEQANAVCVDKRAVSCETIKKSECGPFCRETQCGPLVLDVDPGKTYRLRIASTTSLSALNVQVQGHKMTVVEADGNYVTPFVVDSIDLYSGDSYSVLIKTDQRPQAYWISVGVRGRKPKTLPALAILRYSNSGPGSSWPRAMPPATPDWEDVNLSKNFTYIIKAAPGTPKPEREPTGDPIVMLNTQDVVNDQVKWAINHVSLRLPTTPYLGAYYARAERDVFDTAEAPRGFNASYDIMKPPEAQAPGAKTPTTVSDRVYRFKDGEVVDVVIQNANMRKENTSEAHPWHLHGHDFWVLGYGEGRYNHTVHSQKLNKVNPPLRNTVVVFPHGWTA